MARPRFDDVEYRIVEEPGRPRRRLSRRWALGGAAALIAAGGVAVGTSKLPHHPNGVLPGRHMHYGAAALPPAAGRRMPVADAIRTSATSADLARAERFKRSPLYGRILRGAAKAG